VVAREFRPQLSTSPSGRVFISKFKAADQEAATQLVDALVLMNEADVAGETGIGVAGHRKARKFASTIGMRRHITGLVAYAHHIEPEYAKACYRLLDSVDWSV
jgi:hypothetical protein